MALADGKREASVMDRTGHTTSSMMNIPPRSSLAELALRGLTPLASAIPELAARTEKGPEKGPEGEEVDAGSAGESETVSDSGEFSGGSSRIRTEGQWIKNPLLYQLS